MYCDPSIKTDCHVQEAVVTDSSRTTAILYMSLLSADTVDEESQNEHNFQSSSLLFADSIDEESQNNEDNLQSSAWRSIEIDEKALKGVIEEIIHSTDDLPDQITEAANVISKISWRINAIMISLCLLARITNPCLFSCYGTTRKILSGLYSVLQSWSSSFGSHTRNRTINHWVGHFPSLKMLSIVL